MLGIIIPTKDNITDLFKCLESIKKSTSIDYQIYVADTGSTDPVKNATKELLNTLFESNSTFIEYDYYNFAKINNDVVINHVTNDVDVLMFCNNDIVIGVVGLIDRLYETIIEHSDVIGTCGCRLLYPNKLIQHDGQVVKVAKDFNNFLILTHSNLNIPSSNIINPYRLVVDGNTFALTVVLKSTFEDIGMLNDNYIECFEDVEFNLRCRNIGLQNILLESKYWAYHHESKTRGTASMENPDMIQDHQRITEYVNTTYTLDIERVLLDENGDSTRDL